MELNPYVFFMAKSQSFIIWDYKAHKQYELDLSHAMRLVELIVNPEKFDLSNAVDVVFFENRIFISEASDTEPYWGWDHLSKIFHIGTKNIPHVSVPADTEEWAHLYYHHCSEIIAKPWPEIIDRRVPQELTILPDPHDFEFAHENLTGVLIERKTCRVFERILPLSQAQLSAILYFSFGYLKERDRDEFVLPEFGARRSSPSGGGLNACEVYVYVNNVNGLDVGIYRYDAALNTLSFLSAPDETLGELLAGQHFVNDIPFGVFLTARFDKMWWKYQHSRAYRVSLLDIGHLSQTFQLVSTAAGLGTWLTAAFSDDGVEKALRLSGCHEQPLLFVGAGYSNGATFCKELVDVLRKDHDVR